MGKRRAGAGHRQEEVGQGLGQSRDQTLTLGNDKVRACAGGIFKSIPHWPFSSPTDFHGSFATELMGAGLGHCCVLLKIQPIYLGTYMVLIAAASDYTMLTKALNQERF